MTAGPAKVAVSPRAHAWSAQPASVRDHSGMAGLTMHGTPSLRLPGEHFAAALLFLSAGALGLIWIAPELAAGLYLSPHVAGVTHCFTLGWLSMTILGALYQLLPVALGVPILSERAGHVSFWTFAPGVASFASGVAFGVTLLRSIGVALIGVGVVCVVVNVALSLRRVTARTVIWTAIALALSFLTVTLAMGALLAENLRRGFLGNWRVHVLAAHLHIALLGWALMMIVGISHRLLPMFLLAHNADTRWTRHALGTLAPGVVLLGCGLVTSHGLLTVTATWIGVALVEAAVICFLIQTRLFFNARRRPRLDAGLRHAAIALAFLAMTAALGPVVLLSGAAQRRLDVAYVALGLLGALTMYVIGQFYKVVPFLGWMARFRNDMGKRPVPTVTQLYSSRVAHVGLVSLVAGVAGIACGTLAGNIMLVRASAVVFTVGVVAFVSQMIRVAFGTAPAGATTSFP